MESSNMDSFKVTIADTDSSVEKQQPNRHLSSTVFWSWLKFAFILIVVAIMIISFVMHLHFKPLTINHVLTNMTSGPHSEDANDHAIVICETEECKMKAASLQSSMNTSADPCQDFFEFACGKWDYKSASGVNIPMMQTTERILFKLMDLAEQIDENSTRPLKQLKGIYDSCVNFNSENVDIGVFPMEMLKVETPTDSLSVNPAPQLIQFILASNPATTIRRSACIELLLRDLMPFATAHNYILEQVSKESIVELREMHKHFMTALGNFVPTLGWMDQNTKHGVTKSIRDIKFDVEYIELLRNPDVINACYQGLELLDGSDNATFPGIVHALKRWDLGYNRECILSSVINAKSVDSPLGILPYFHNACNEMVIQAGILQQPYFSNGLRAADYGALGMIMGHELIHGFHEALVKEVTKSNSIPSPERNSTVWHEYDRKAQCFVQQYDGYWVTDVGQSLSEIGKKDIQATCLEDMADTMGLQLSYQAYKMYMDQRGRPEPRYPGLEQYTPEQILSLSFANEWCSSSKIPSVRDLEMDPIHSPAKYRVIGSLSNSPEFAKAWQCPESTRMNPKKKCNL